MQSKSKDYATVEDILSTFKKIAILTNLTTEQIILVFQAVKLVRVTELLSNNREPNNESIKDSISDARNYWHLLDCALTEKRE